MAKAGGCAVVVRRGPPTPRNGPHRLVAACLQCETDFDLNPDGTYVACVVGSTTLGYVCDGCLTAESREKLRTLRQQTAERTQAFLQRRHEKLRESEATR